MNGVNSSNFIFQGVSSMQYAIEVLNKEREEIIIALKNGQQEKLNDLQQVDKAIGWIELLKDNNLDKVSRYVFDELPYIEGYGGFTSYRLMIDKETDNTDDWVEYKKPDGTHYQLALGDFLLVHKPHS